MSQNKSGKETVRQMDFVQIFKHNVLAKLPPIQSSVAKSVLALFGDLLY